MNRHLKLWCWIFLLLIPVYSNAAWTLVAGSKDTADGSTNNDSNQGPATDGYSTTMFNAGASQIVIKGSSGLQYSNIKLHFQADTAANPGTGVIYCSRAGNGTAITLESHFVRAPYSYDGHQLFMTNIAGLYFTMRMYNIHSYKTTSNADFYIGDMPQQDLSLSWSSCGNTGVYQKLGGIVSDIEIDFYNDATFNPGSSGSISLLSDSSYHYSFRNLSPGGNLNSHYIYQTYNLANITLSSPTCTSAILSGNTVTKGDTVALGEYAPKEIIDGAAGIPFAITLQNCYRASNVEVKLTTGAPAMSASLLGNSLTADAAAGVGVEITGASNSHFPEMVLLPNDDSSVYKAYVDNPDNSNGIIGAGTSGTPASQQLDFIATLKQDNNQQIRAGDFKATAVFSITYP
ncbi:fimbrial protein [Escherichia albertii]|uniref:fimbrial protein n=1 Tax=Escherichia albertii TaxID=208962 RepID=UPI0017E907E9|nr:fimbrial protein [Escherichia albertii]EEU9596289.1 fimbrial protein [Escherichia albertii]EGE0299532.1 fimbrial protein [Escherichia albertii]EKD4812362.1 fimbrial protein [Escherichia albertii]MCI5278877.1 fimbrial protein [Escherichia albertii]MCZ8661957.1 fimbrial protein [Escherichia albertii]